MPRRALALTLSWCLACNGGGGAETDTDADTDTDDTGSAFTVDCASLGALMVTTPTDSIDDWSGFWQCFQEEQGCSGESCSWRVEDLPRVVVEEDCATAASQTCTVDGETVAWCTRHEQVGYVEIDCGTEGEIAITANGLPGHTIENYASSGTLPPLLGSAAGDTVLTLPTHPVYLEDHAVEVFTGARGSAAVAANGVSIFNQFTGAQTVAVTDEIVDDCGGHPANGTYHYHALPVCGALVDRYGGASEHSGLLGMAADGYPVFGPYGFDHGVEANGVARIESCYGLTSGCDETDADCYGFDQAAFDAGECHLDVCNGMITEVPSDLQDAFGERIYAYYMTMDADGNAAFPYLPYCYRGEASGGGGGP